jgi:hypothetical protein
MDQGAGIKDHVEKSDANLANLRASQGHMMHLRNMIEDLRKRVVASDLIASHTNCPRAQLYNADLARELRDVLQALKIELARREALHESE